MTLKDYSCHRCDWPTGETLDGLSSRQALTVHSIEADHPLCQLCLLSLADTEPAVCEKCLRRVGEHLKGVIAMWVELRGYLGHARTQVYDAGHGTEDGDPLPGGDVLVLVGPGSSGVSDRSDRRDRDVPSIARFLGTWETAWREARGDDLDTVPLVHPGRGGVVYAAAGYLERHARWAANNHPDFADYAKQLDDLHNTLEVATGRTRHPAKAAASCFACGGTIVWPVDRGTGMELPTLRCRDCRQVYQVGQYLLALRAQRESDLSGWLPITDAAIAAYRSPKTLRTWAARGDVESLRWCPTCKHEVPFGPLTAVEAEHVLQTHVWWPDVHGRTREAEHRHRPRGAGGPPKPDPFAELLERTRATRREDIA